MQVTKPQRGMMVFHAVHQGHSNFAVWAKSSAGENIDLLVNTIGAYSGSSLLDTDASKTTGLFEITADGPWSIDVMPLVSAPQWSGSAPAQGTGDSILIIPGGLPKLAIVRIIHDGKSNFAIWAYSTGSRDLVVNDIGAYNAKHTLAKGILVLEIHADGNWAITPTG